MGSAIARELSRYQLKTVVLEKEEDVCCGTSKANSAIVHAGFDAKPGSMKAKMNVEGSKRMEALSKELDFPYKRNGSLGLCFSLEDLPRLQELKRKGREKRGSRTGNYFGRKNMGDGAESIQRGKSHALCPYRRHCMSIQTYHCVRRKMPM